MKRAAIGLMTIAALGVASTASAADKKVKIGVTMALFMDSVLLQRCRQGAAVPIRPLCDPSTSGCSTWLSSATSSAPALDPDRAVLGQETFRGQAEQS